MVLEYLFLEKEYKNAIEQLNFKYEIKNKGQVTQTIQPSTSYTTFGNFDIWVVKYEVTGENLNNAKCLSELNSEIISNYNPTVLRNDASAYFNEHLYPLVNKFERVLRQFLYLKSALYKGDKLKKIIENLETKDFGEIYTLLFIDDDFCKQAKAKINSKDNGNSGIYSKEDIINLLSKLDEITVWDKIVGNNTLTYIKKNFRKIIFYRNDIMHAHNIDYSDYRRAKHTFEKALKCLEEEIEKIIKYPETKEKAEYVVTTLYDKLQSTDSEISNITSNFEHINEIIRLLTSSASDIPHLEEVSQKLSQFPELSSKFTKATEEFSKCTSLLMGLGKNVSEMPFISSSMKENKDNS